MSELRVRLDKYLEHEEREIPQAMASIRRLDVSSGATPGAKSVVQWEQVPVSDNQDIAKSIKLDPGHYRVQVALPSGEIIADDVRVSPNSKQQLVLRGRASPHEWLGWQNLQGNAVTDTGWMRWPKFPGSAQPERPAPKKKKLARKKRAGGAGSTKVRRTPALRRSASARSASPNSWLPIPSVWKAVSEASTVKIAESVYWLSNPDPVLSSGDWLNLCEHVAAIQGITATTKHPNHSRLALLNQGRTPRRIAPNDKDAHRAVFRVVYGSSSTGRATALSDAARRSFLAVPFRDAIELVSLPMPWLLLTSGRQAVIELAVQRTPRAYEFGSSVAVHDPHLALLLGYLSSGAVTAAGEIAARAEDLLLRKVRNPLAAAAGAYALIGIETDTSGKTWHSWVRNLNNLPQQLPDAAIQLGVLTLRRSHSRSSEALALFKQACARGLPYYSLGLRWLLDGLERFAPRDTEAACLLQRVRTITLRMHPQSPFTILRFHNHVAAKTLATPVPNTPRARRRRASR